MNIEHDNFVGVYDGYFSNEYCNSLIKYFEWCNTNNRSYRRPEKEFLKNDKSTVLNPQGITDIIYTYENIQPFIEEFNNTFWDICYKDYSETYSVLANYDRHTIYTYKIQRTDPAEGYHVWHAEDGDINHSRRVGVYILYLNDVEQGGETEFLYLSKRIEAKAGRLVIFPPNYPWAHRGNPPLSGSKYILTGWTEYA
jgi:hypothetical protein